MAASIYRGLYITAMEFHNVILFGGATNLNLQCPSTEVDHGPGNGLIFEPVRPLTPDGVFPLPQRAERFGDFIWEPSQSTGVIGEQHSYTN